MAVADIIADQQEYASNAVSSADAFLESLGELSTLLLSVDTAIADIPSPGYSFDTSEETIALLTGFFPDALTVADITAIAPTFTPEDIDPLEDVPVADFTKVAPTISFPEAPSSALPSVPTAPSIADPVLPSAPVVTLPTAPTIGSITLPEAPSIEIPTFESSLPIDDLVTPTAEFTFNEVAYQSALLDALTAKLLSDMENGGYGIEPADESALFDRARTRELEAAQAEQDTLVADAAARGWMIPPGDLTVVLQRSHQALQGRVSTINRDIVLKRSELYVENRKFTIEQAKALEDTLIGYHNSVMERALNASKAVVEAAIQIYNAQVARFNARIARYQAEGTVFRARVDAALAQVEVYRVQMEGKKVEVDVQRAQVDIYNAQINGANSLINLYKTQMEAAQVQANIEQLRLQSFRALIDSYVAQVQAKVAEFNMFESRIKGETAKVQAYESEVRAYVATVEGAKAKASIAIARLDGDIKEQQQRIDVFQARMQAYQSDIDAQAKTIAARTQVYGAQVQGASAKANAVGEAHRLEVTKKDLEFRRNVENARIKIDEAKLSLQAFVSAAEIRMKAADSASRYYGALIGAAVNSINTLTGLIATE